jgi:hypothetical protein
LKKQISKSIKRGEVMPKRIFFIVFAIWVGLSVVNLAQMRSPEERAKQLTERLKLTKDQEKKIENIYQKQQEKMQKIVQQGDGFRDPSNREKMMKLREESNSEIMKLLKKDQKEEFKKFMDEQKKRMEERRKNRNGN